MEWLENRHATSGLPSAMFVRPSVYREVAGTYAERARGSGSEDQYFKWPLAARHAVAVHDEALVRYRIHRGAVSRNRPASRYLRDWVSSMVETSVYPP